MSGDLSLALVFSDEQLDALADRVAAILAARDARPGPAVPELLTAHEAAALLRCGRKRIYAMGGEGRIRQR